MKKYCAYVLLFLSCLASTAMAQEEVDYEDDINPYMVGDSIDLIIPQLVNYQESHADHAASNLQLARIFENRFKQADYLIDYESAIANAKKSQLLYSKSINLVDEREVRKNEWYYPNFTDEFKKNGKPILNYDRIQEEIRRGLAEADSFLTYMPEIHQNFMAMVASYDQATKTFVRLNGEYSSLKDLYLLFDEALDKRLETLKSGYDSTLFYFEAYQAAAAKYPPFQVRQSLSFKKINTYRLDGLVIQTDFFKARVELWEYNEWVDEVRKKVEDEIKSLRGNIDKIEGTLAMSFKKLATMDLSDSINLDPINKKEIYKIRKYDLNSPVANLFQYKDDKLDVVYEQKTLKRFDTMATVSPQLKLFAFNRLFQKVLAINNAIIANDKALANSNLQKNESFYARYYGGIEGVSTYFKKEAEWSSGLMQLTADSIKKQIVYTQQIDYQQPPLIYKGSKLEYLSPLKNDFLDKAINRITAIDNNVNQISYLTGYFFTKDSVRQSFVAARKAKKVLWYKPIKPKTKGSTEWQQIGGMSLTGGGDLTYQLYTRNSDSLNFINTIIKIDEAGKLLNELKINTENQPIYLSNLRNSEINLSVYQGHGFGQAVWPTTVTIVKFHPDSSNYQLKELNIKGKFIGLFKLEKGVVFVAQSEDGKQVYFTKVGTSFDIDLEKTFTFNTDQQLEIAYPLSDQSLHVISENSAGHLVINDELNLLYSASSIQKE